MDISVALSTFALLFLAEIGDKTQVITMTLAHRYRLMPVVLGVFFAFLTLNLMAVWVGDTLYRLVPARVILLVAGALFMVFAYRSWRHSAEVTEETEHHLTGDRGALLASFLLVFFAELGDKTQLVLITLAAGSGALWSVFVGGTLALWSVSLLAIALGRTVLRRVPKRWIHRAAAVLFFCFGMLTLVKVLNAAT